MNEDRPSGLALIAGSFGFIITMALHPTGHQFLEPGRLEEAARLGVFVHALALCSLPILFLGAWGLSRSLSGSARLVQAALVLYAGSLIAGMNAAVVSGLVAPSLFRDFLASGASPESTIHLLLNYSGLLNQAFAKVLVAGSSGAVLLWSAALLRGGARGRGLGIYGCVFALLTLLALFSGHLRLDVHGFGLFVLGQSAFLIAAGVLLCRRARPATPSPP
jgi:hypothetical protein